LTSILTSILAKKELFEGTRKSELASKAIYNSTKEPSCELKVALVM
jgi:hypothetical protein